MHISELWIYPIKSLGGISLSESKALSNGLQYDREWMLVDDEGVFLTQREYANLARIKVAITEDESVHCSFDKYDIIFKKNQYLDEISPGAIWKSKVKIQEVDTQVSEWFSDMLTQNVRLVRMAKDTDRKRYAHKINENFTTLFADGYPYLMLSQSAVTLLNEKLKTPVKADRFRANIIIDDCTAHAEDEFTKFSIGDVEFTNAKPCVRCILINTDQQSGARGREPLATLATYRNKSNKILFGVNLLAQNEGMIRVGDGLDLS